MNQNQNNINSNNNSNSTSNLNGGMNFVTGEASVPQQSVSTQTIAQQPISVNADSSVENVTTIPQQVTPQSIVSQPVAENVQPSLENTSTVQQSISNVNLNSIQQVNNIPVQEQPIQNQMLENVQPVQSVNGLNTLPPVQPTVTTEISPNAVNSSLGDEVHPKKKNMLVILLVIVLLTVIGVVLGIFLFNKFGKKDNNVSDTSVVQKNDNVSLNNNVINNTGVDDKTLREVLNLVGIASTSDTNNNDALNYYISNNNYVNEANNIILYYAVNDEGKTSSQITLPEGYDIKSDVGACSDAVNCALISREDAEKILKVFKLGDDLSKYFYKSSEIDDTYGIHYDVTLPFAIFNGDNLGISHNLSASLENESTIKVDDNQTIDYLDDNGNVLNISKVVTYIFKVQDSYYYLDSVSVSE